MARPTNKERLKRDIRKVLEFVETDYVKIRVYNEVRANVFDKNIAHCSTIAHHFKSWQDAMKQARRQQIEDSMKKDRSFKSSAGRKKDRRLKGCKDKNCQWRKGRACLFPKCIRHHGWSEGVKER